MCVCARANFLRRPGFLCGRSALCIWGIDRIREVEGGGGVYGFLGGCQRSRSEI